VNERDRPADEARAREWERDIETEAAADGAPVGHGRTILVCRSQAGARVVELSDGEELLVGRGAEAGIDAADSRASRRHAIIRRRGEVVFVADLGSRNGTAVGERTLKSAELALSSGDVIRIGAFEIIVASATPQRSDAGAREGGAGGDVVVADPEVERVYRLAKKAARTNTTVLVLGETGSGKEVLAQWIHAESSRAAGPFHRINCGAIPEGLLESELFGHEKGAFTGADRRKTGYFEAASGGTLLLDEVGELSPSAQVKLLNVLETRSITRLGDTAPRTIDVRVVAATHRDLAAEVKSGRFRADLFYRVSSFTLRLPPLRERLPEIAALAHNFARSFAAAAGDPAPSLSKEALSLLLKHPFPGNVRELRNIIEHAMVLAEGASVLLPEHLPDDLTASRRADRVGMRGQIAELERKAIQEALAASGNNQTRAAERLGISRRALVYKLARMRERK
jgi:two-component system, NtrC family, response regulator AtoC